MHHPDCELPWCPANSDQPYNTGEDLTDCNGQQKPAGGSAGHPAQARQQEEETDISLRNLAQGERRNISCLPGMI